MEKGLPRSDVRACAAPISALIRLCGRKPEALGRIEAFIGLLSWYTE